jgi:DNA excision repair protein ERCC-6-like
MGLGKTV